MNFWKAALKTATHPKVIATGLACTVGTVVIANACTRKSKQEAREYAEKPRVKCVDGELYKKMPDGTLVPYFARGGQSRNGNRNSSKRKANSNRRHALPQMTSNVDVIYIKGRPYVLDDRGNYVPVRMPSRAKRKRR